MDDGRNTIRFMNSMFQCLPQLVENPMQTHKTLHGFVTRHNSALHELTLFDILLRNQHIY